MAKIDPDIDVLVLGEHPAAYLAAALVRHKSKFRTVHACIPEERFPDRLVLINPALYSLHPILESLKRKVDTKGIYGLQFLSDDPATRSEYRSKSAVNCVGTIKDVRLAMEDVARKEDVEFIKPRQLQILRIDEKGMEVQFNNRDVLRPKALILGGRLPVPQEKMLGLPDEWEQGVVHRYSYVKVKTKHADLGGRPLVPMSLDLKGTLGWAWLLPGDKYVQIVVEQPLDTLAQNPPAELLRHWADVLHKHGILKGEVDLSAAESLDIPFGGALMHEGVANRTLLVGPAGGFYSGSAEDVYPNCWSALFAADVMKKALKEPHLQDAIQAYRQKWRTTLGEYLRGPQQNLRFLLPLVYRNQIMTNRLAEAILTGKSVVR